VEGDPGYHRSLSSLCRLALLRGFPPPLICGFLRRSSLGSLLRGPGELFPEGDVFPGQNSLQRSIPLHTMEHCDGGTLRGIRGVGCRVRVPQERNEVLLAPLRVRQADFAPPEAVFQLHGLVLWCGTPLPQAVLVEEHLRALLHIKAGLRSNV